MLYYYSISAGEPRPKGEIIIKDKIAKVEVVDDNQTDKLRAAIKEWYKSYAGNPKPSLDYIKHDQQLRIIIEYSKDGDRDGRTVRISAVDSTKQSVSSHEINTFDPEEEGIDTIEDLFSRQEGNRSLLNLADLVQILKLNAENNLREG